MNIHPLDVLTAALLLVALWSVLCRLNKMVHRVTRPEVVAQHMGLGMGLAAALVLPPQQAKAAMAAAIVWWLLAGAHRWRYAAPAGTETAPGELDALGAPRMEADT